MTWLQRFIEDAVGRTLCTEIGCTTCGAREFRLGLLEAFAEHSGRTKPGCFDGESARAVGCDLAGVQPSTTPEEIERAVMLILYEVWATLGEAPAESLVAPHLAGTWSGEILVRMQAHHKSCLEEQREYAQSQSP